MGSAMTEALLASADRDKDGLVTADEWHGFCASVTSAAPATPASDEPDVSHDVSHDVSPNEPSVEHD